MDTTLTNRKLSFLLNEISISNALTTSLQNYKRLMIPVFVASVIAAVSLSGNERWIPAFIAAYSVFMLAGIDLRARRAERIEGALRGLILTSEFGLLDSDSKSPPGVTGYIGSLVHKRRQIWTREAALEVLNGDMDLGRIIEEYWKSLGSEKRP